MIASDSDGAAIFWFMSIDNQGIKVEQTEIRDLRKKKCIIYYINKQ